MSNLVSSCCSAGENRGGVCYSDLGFCSECKEHCEYIDEEAIEAEKWWGSREFTPEQAAYIAACEAAPTDDEGYPIFEDEEAIK